MNKGIRRARTQRERRKNYFREAPKMGLDDYLKLVQEGLKIIHEREAAEAAESGCAHEWVPEGQTLSGNIEFCMYCRRIRIN